MRTNQRSGEKSESNALLRFMPLIAMASMAVLAYLNRDSLTLEALLYMLPKGTVGGLVFLLGLYCLKSMSIVFPLIILYLLGGRLFSPVFAILANALGIVCALLLQYAVGRLSGGNRIKLLCQRFPKMNHVIEIQKTGTFLSPFLLRMIGIIPFDVTSLYFGASRHPFGAYLIGGVLGVLPNLVFTTLLGASLSSPGSPMFWMTLSGKFMLLLGAFLVSYCYRKRHANSFHR
ncbi:MAG: hypothetical protein K0Q48_1234 [Bacillota bacterium]|jgi:uncharacterized membrane protein YdjX (TVP38/TMEM64 family)|nr:hypothetical protein [Bacillota bacterium]